MGNLQKTTGPEIDPRDLRKLVDVEGVVNPVKRGEIIFNRRPPLSPQDPRAIIEGAIAGGDTMERRVQQFQEAMLF